MNTEAKEGLAPAVGQRVEAVERALSILSTFSETASSLTLADLSRRTGLYKSTILRLAASLERNGYLVRDDARRFTLGVEIARLGAVASPKLDLTAGIRRSLRKLVALTSETASFYLRDGDFRVCLFRENSPRSARHHLEEGARLPIASGAAGHVLVAFSAPPGTDRHRAIREQGWAVSDGERDPDVAAVAVPVFDAAQRLVGALSVSGLRSRFGYSLQQQAAAALTQAAASLQGQYGAAFANMPWGPGTPATDARGSPSTADL